MTIMTHDTSALAAPAAPATGAFARAVNFLWQGFKAHREMSAQRLLVASLSDRQLADLGISREFVQRRDFMDPHAI